MMGRTHLAIGFLAAILIAPLFPEIHWSYFIPLLLLGVLMPDVDHENSKINRMIPVTRWIPHFFRHRGFFHSAFPAAIILIIAYAANGLFIGIPLALGYLIHLASDCLTRMGCNLLYPISTFRIQGFVMTDGLMELVVLVGVSVASAVLVVLKLQGLF